MIGRLTYCPVARPLASGEYATTVIPSSRQVRNKSILGSSISSVKGEYSTWYAAMGWTAFARRTVLAVHSESPIYFVLPALKQDMVNGEGAETQIFVLLDEFGHGTNSDLRMCAT